MRRRRWCLFGLAFALLAACVGMWQLPSMPPEGADADKGVSDMIFGLSYSDATWFQKWRLQVDMSQRPDAYADMVVRHAKQLRRLGVPGSWGNAPLAFYDAMALRANDPDWKVRATCAEVLLQSHKLRERESAWRPLVTQWLKDENTAVVGRAVFIVEARGSPAAPEVRALSQSDFPGIRLAVARALTKVATPEERGKDDIAVLRTLASDADQKVRAQAKHALNRVGIRP